MPLHAVPRVISKDLGRGQPMNRIYDELVAEWATRLAPKHVPVQLTTLQRVRDALARLP